MKPYVPLGILYLSSFLKQNGMDVTLYDSTFKSKEEQRQQLLKSKPDVVAVYCNLMTKLNVLSLIKFIRSSLLLKDSKIILGGPEPPFYAKEFLDYGADIIVEGEGEVTMMELCRELEKTSPELTNVRGLIFRNDNNEIIKTPAREQIKDVNELPYPDRENVDIQLYLDAWKKAHGYSSVSINTQRGCPYTCKWCSHSVYGTTYRRRSPDKTADEVEWIIKNYNPDMLWFVDDVFTMSHKWLFELEQIFNQRNIKIRFECITRSDRMNEKVIKSLKNLGCFRVWIGAESGSQRVLDLMDRRVKADNVREMIKLTKKYGIETGTFIMIGYPGEKKNDIIETAEHLKLSDPDIFLTTVAYPIKGTRLFTEVESDIISKMKWDERTDRDLDLKGRYSKKFYKHANRYLVNEVNNHKYKLNGRFDIKTFLKAKVSRLMMVITS